MATPESQNIPGSDDAPESTADFALQDMVEFADNPEPRCPCVLLLDTSISMNANDAIGALNEGIQTFKSELEKDDLAALRVEVAIITFGNGVEVAQDFVTVDQFNPPVLEADGDSTPMSQGIQAALDHVEGRKQRYRESGIGYYRPWVFMITDGEPTGETWDMVNAATERLAREESDKRVAFFAAGVEGANMEMLSQIVPRTPLPLKGLAFNELFVWLSASMSQVSRSRTDDEVQLDTDALKDWAAI